MERQGWCDDHGCGGVTVSAARVAPARSVLHTLGVADPFDFPALRVQQPAKFMPNHACYEIFSEHRRLLAVATESGTQARVQLPTAPVSTDARVLSVTTPVNEPVLTLTKRGKDRITDLRSPSGELLGQIRATHTTRHYTLMGDQGQTVGKVVGDLALKHFSVADEAGEEFARIRKTWAGLTKELLTPSDHYKVEFTAPVSPSARLLTVMTAIVLDLTLYGRF